MYNYFLGILSAYWLLQLMAVLTGRTRILGYTLGVETPWNWQKILFVGFCVLAVVTMTYQSYNGGK